MNEEDKVLKNLIQLAGHEEVSKDFLFNTMKKIKEKPIIPIFTIVWIIAFYLFLSVVVYLNFPTDLKKWVINFSFIEPVTIYAIIGFSALIWIQILLNNLIRNY